MIDKEEYRQRDAALRQWGRSQIGPLKAEVESLKIRRHTGQFMRYLKDRYGRRSGRINSVAFQMPRHAIFLHKGVGRGYPIDAVGGRALGLSNSKKRKALEARGYNNRAIGRFLSNTDKMAAKTRIPKPWFNPVMDRAVPQLADTMAKFDADLLARNIYIL